jgi:hypothetical protein
LFCLFCGKERRYRQFAGYEKVNIPLRKHYPDICPSGMGIDSDEVIYIDK